MTKSAERIVHLIGKYLLNELSPQEEVELDHWIALSPDNQLSFEKLTDLDLLAEKMKDFLSIDDGLSLQPEPVLHQKVIH